jgi:hypothetical protein
MFFLFRNLSPGKSNNKGDDDYDRENREVSVANSLKDFTVSLAKMLGCCRKNFEFSYNGFCTILIRNVRSTFHSQFNNKMCNFDGITIP